MKLNTKKNADKEDFVIDIPSVEEKSILSDEEVDKIIQEIENFTLDSIK